MKNPSSRALDARQKQQRLQWGLGGGLLTLCLAFAAWDFFAVKPPPAVPLPAGYVSSIESCAELSVRSIRSARSPVDLTNPRQRLGAKARAAIVEFLLGEVSFWPTQEQQEGPFIELWFRVEEQELRVLVTEDFGAAVFEGPVVTDRFRLGGAKALKTLLQNLPSDGA